MKVMKTIFFLSFSLLMLLFSCSEIKELKEEENKPGSIDLSFTGIEGKQFKFQFQGNESIAEGAGTQTLKIILDAWGDFEIKILNDLVEKNTNLNPIDECKEIVPKLFTIALLSQTFNESYDVSSLEAYEDFKGSLEDRAYQAFLEKSTKMLELDPTREDYEGMLNAIKSRIPEPDLIDLTFTGIEGKQFQLKMSKEAFDAEDGDKILLSKLIELKQEILAPLVYLYYDGDDDSEYRKNFMDLFIRNYFIIMQLNVHFKGDIKLADDQDFISFKTILFEKAYNAVLEKHNLNRDDDDAINRYYEMVIEIKSRIKKIQK